MGIERYLSSPEETEALGRRLGARASAGTVFALTGDLGAGKSCLARGIGRGLGVVGRMPSPTFVIVASYDTDELPFHHLDLYRLGAEDELEQLGLDGILFADGVCAVEWPERAPDLLRDALWITLIEEGEGRRVCFEGPAERWEALLVE